MTVVPCPRSGEFECGKSILRNAIVVYLNMEVSKVIIKSSVSRANSMAYLLKLVSMWKVTVAFSCVSHKKSSGHLNKIVARRRAFKQTSMPRSYPRCGARVIEASN